jgi:hypothetical protein
MRERAAWWLAGRLEDASVDVEEPAVIAAADAALGDDAVLERRAAMGAVLVQEADVPREVAEDHQILAQDPDCQRQIGQLRCHRDRMPEAAHVLAAGCAAADPRQLFVGRRIERQMIAPERRGSTGHA